MSLYKVTRNIILLLAAVMVLPGYAQQSNLVLEDTTITTQATFTSYNSISTGSNFTIAGTGDATLTTRENIYFKPGFVIVQGGKLRTINDPSVVNNIEPVSAVIPDRFTVQQNYPNPFNPTTVISYSLPQSESVTIIVYNILGKTIRNLVSQVQKAGTHSVIWDARSNAGVQVSNGTYFYMVKAGDLTAIKKMVLLR